MNALLWKAHIRFVALHGGGGGGGGDASVAALNHVSRRHFCIFFGGIFTPEDCYCMWSLEFNFVMYLADASFKLPNCFCVLLSLHHSQPLNISYFSSSRYRFYSSQTISVCLYWINCNSLFHLSFLNDCLSVPLCVSFHNINSDPRSPLRLFLSQFFL